MPRFRPPIHLTVAAATVVAGLASYQGVDHLVLAKSQGPAAAHEPSPGGDHGPQGPKPGHGTDETTSTTAHHDELPPPKPTTTVPATTTTEHREKHPEPPTTVTTIHREKPRDPSSTTSVTEAPKPPPPPPDGVQTLSFYCGSGMSGDQAAAKCRWSQSNSPSFDHYRLTRELVGTPRQTIFESTDRST